MDKVTALAKIFNLTDDWADGKIGTDAAISVIREYIGLTDD